MVFRRKLTAGSAVCYAEGEYGMDGDAGGRVEYAGGGGEEQYTYVSILNINGYAKTSSQTSPYYN